MKKIIFLSTALVAITSSGCAYNSVMGENDRFKVSSTTSLFAPSVTTVVDTKKDTEQTFAGSSIIGQVAGAAGMVGGSALIGHGLGKSGSRITQGQTAAGTSTATSKSDAASSSNSTSTVNIGE